VLTLDRASAQTAITNAGLAVGSVSTLNNCVDPGTVQIQNPSPGVVVALNTPVNITVSTCVSTGGPGGGGTTGGGGGGGRPPILPK
jgi:beta-lactam-binding protein with PASTA domain